MDEEQIWQQLEMQNDAFWDKCMAETCRILAFNEDKLHFNVKYADQSEDEPNESEIDEENNDLVRSDESESENDNERQSDNDIENENDDSNENSELDDDLPAQEVKKSSIVDDQFFNLSEMEAFLDQEDKKELNRLNGKKIQSKGEESSEDEDEIDYFETLSDSDESENESRSEFEAEHGTKPKDVMYSNFFEAETKQRETRDQFAQRKRSERDEKNKRKVQEMKEDLGIDESEGSEDSEQENDDVEKSEFNLRQERLNKRIEELEENALGEKPWQLKGEITSSTRPKNSLLEEVLEFDSTSRPPPLITEETTLCLEDIIKRRIKSNAWDDVERKIKPINDNQDFRKTLVLSQEKSKESLAQIYEKEYLEKVHKLNNVDDVLKPDEPPEHTEIRKAIKDLFVKLDALSNFHFTAKPIAAEAKIITNIPAIEMEEVAPIAVSDATLLAPEEVRKRPVGDEIGKLERTSTDKKRERRKKKNKQKVIKKQQDKQIEEKEKLGIKVTTKEKQQQLMKQVTKSRNVIKVSLVIDIEY